MDEDVPRIVEAIMRINDRSAERRGLPLERVRHLRIVP